MDIMDVEIRRFQKWKQSKLQPKIGYACFDIINPKPNFLIYNFYDHCGSTEHMKDFYLFAFIYKKMIFFSCYFFLSFHHRFIKK